MENLLKRLEIDSFQEIETLIRSVHLPRETGQFLKGVVPLTQICQLLYLMITRDIEIEQVNDTNVLVKHSFHLEEGFITMLQYAPELHELLSKSQESGFHILIAKERSILEYISKMKDKKSCPAGFFYFFDIFNKYIKIHFNLQFFLGGKQK